jgi:GntR family transcriptional regulator/MocR family aminotransferase
MHQSEQPKPIDASDLPLCLSMDKSIPGYLQLASQLQALIDSNTLPSGTKLPASRRLARVLGVNRNTVVAAFERLSSLGLVETRGRAGTVISELAGPKAVAALKRGKLPQLVGARSIRQPSIDFRLGLADPTPLPLKVWRRACREAGRQLPSADYGDPAGDSELRAQIALYLGRTRAMRVHPDQVTVTAGARRAIERIAELSLRAGDCVAVEEPGYPGAAEAFRRRGARLVPIPVDEDGLKTDRLTTEKRAIRLIHVTPSHQYPLGARLSAARRHALIRWCREHRALVIENDYDGEFRYGTAPLPALGSIAGFDQIAYVGTFSKVLSPAIRLGFVVAHADLIGAMAALIAQERDSVSIVTQRIVAWLIKSGELERHVRRARKTYSIRRAAMLQALSQIPQIASMSGQAAGLHVVIKLRREIPNKELLPQLEAQGIAVDRVADFESRNRTDDRLLMAYGHLTEADIVDGVRRFAAAIRVAAPHS